MKQRLFSRLFIILPAVLGLSLISIGNAFAADPVTIRYEVTTYQTSLGFVTCYNQNGERTELLADGTTAWSYEFTTTNLGQWVSVHPAPVDNPQGTSYIESKVYLNGVLYRTATGQNAAAASIGDTLGNLLTTGPGQQWIIRYEITTQQTALGLVTYSNNHTLAQSEILAAGTTAWHYQYTTTEADQPLKIEAVPAASPQTTPYAMVIKIFVNNTNFYEATFGPHTQPAVVNVTLADVLAGRTSPPRNENLGVHIIPGIVPNRIDRLEAATQPATSFQTAYGVDPGESLGGNPAGIRTASFSFFTNNRYVYLTFMTGPQPLAVPQLPAPSNTLLALIPQR